MNKEQTIEGLTYVLTEFFTPDYLNKWISVKERSIHSILSSFGVSTLFSSSLYEVLVSKGLIQRKGFRANMEYKIVTEVIPDCQVLAEEVYRLYYDKAKKHKELAGYTYSKPSDLQPKKVKNKEPKPECRTIYYPDKTFILNDRVFLLEENKIYEGRVVSTFLLEKDSGKEVIHYDVEVTKESSNTKYKHVFHSKSGRCLFSSVEALIGVLTQKVQSYSKV